ncbi:MAG TPA: ECF-type sigma factor [Vicinamibacterales bacterium]|jgi:RNA polymerase sigma factor (TIGR02999 family)|nr:ECF-type sigma factor [Vicinamibacterales bacterium]
MEAGSITRGLADLRAGDPGALERVVSLLYDDLRRLARQRLRGERDGHTLDTTALVHEAYMRLTSQRLVSASDRSEFFAAASNTMRRILVDYARGRGRQKRGAGAARVPIEDVEPFLSARATEETLALDQALTRLAAANPRAASVFEQRLFGGLSLDEIATAHGLSTKTVHRDWEAARSWLRKEVGRDLSTAELPGR